MTRLLKLRGSNTATVKAREARERERGEREERIRIFVLDMLFRVHSTRSRLGPSGALPGFGGFAEVDELLGSDG